MANRGRSRDGKRRHRLARPRLPNLGIGADVANNGRFVDGSARGPEQAHFCRYQITAGSSGSLQDSVMPTARECRHNAEICLKLARETNEIYARTALLEIMFLCGAAIVDLVRTLRLPPDPPTFALAEQEADKKCGPSRLFEQIECREEVWFALTDHQMAAEETWRDAYEKRQERLDNLACDLAVVLGLAVLPPLMLLLPGLVIARVRRGFGRTPHRQKDA